jgi:predicted dehydrogenase
MNRRRFLGKTLATTTMAFSALNSHAEEPAAPATFKRKIKLGVVGLGGRGQWIAGLFQKHGGYQISAVADYFPAVATTGGKALGVDEALCFSGLSGYQKVIASGVEAIVIIDVPYFYPEQTRAAVAAGLHVYMAKPVAVDVPGALAIQEAAKAATQRQRVFLVDYQIPTDPINIEVAQRIRDGGLGKLAQIQTTGMCGGFGDPPKTANLESRLQNLTWVNDIALGCDYIGNFDIHAIDAALWAAGQRPVSAAGASRVCRENPHGDAHDVCSVIYNYADGLVHNHFGQGLANNSDGTLLATFQGPLANAQINYFGKSFVRGGPKHYGGGPVVNLYEAGAVRNIATFHNNVTEGQFENQTVPRAVDGVLTCVLGREAAARKAFLTMDELLKENKKLEVDLTGLKA